MTHRQAGGLAALAVMAVLFYSAKLLFPTFWPCAARDMPFGEGDRATKAVALNMEGQEKGVFFMPPDATVADLLLAAVLQNTLPSRHEGASILRAGDKVYLTAAAAAPVIGKMDAAELLALNLPLDINQVDFEGLVLVPGIGEKTAARIIALREQKKGFRSLTELEEIKGIKKKKLVRLQKYFCVLP